MAAEDQASSHYASLKFPLPAGFFPPPNLSPAHVQAYKQLAEDAADEYMEQYEEHEAMGSKPHYDQPWNFLARVEELTTVWKPNVTPTSETNSVFRCYGQIHGDYRQLLEFYYATSSQKLYESIRFLVDNTIDAQVLANIHTASDGSPPLYLGLKWTAFAPSKFMSRRDNCYLEYLTYRMDSKGREVGIRLTLPVEVPECPLLHDGRTVKRVTARLATIVRMGNSATGTGATKSSSQPSHSSTTQILVMGDLDVKGTFINNLAYKSFMEQINSMSMYVDSKHLSNSDMVSRGKWVPNDRRPTCSVCDRKFNFKRMRHHCRLCGDIVCRRCMFERPAFRSQTQLDKHEDAKNFTISKIKCCVLCMTKLREKETHSETSSYSRFTPKYGNDVVSRPENLLPETNVAGKSAQLLVWNGNYRPRRGATYPDAEGSACDRSKKHWSFGNDGDQAFAMQRSLASTKGEFDSISVVSSTEDFAMTLDDLVDENVRSQRNIAIDDDETMSIDSNLMRPRNGEKDGVGSLSRDTFCSDFFTEDELTRSNTMEGEIYAEFPSKSTLEVPTVLSNGKPADTRSIHDTLQEQTELLRQMVITASGTRQRHPFTKSYSDVPVSEYREALV